MRSLLALPILGCLVASCATHAQQEPVRLQIAPTTLRGQSLLPRITTIELSVYEESNDARCDEAQFEGDGEPLTRAELGRSGCPAGAAFCGSVELDQSEVPRVFAARGLDANGNLFATACTSTTLDRADVSISLAFERYLAEAVCGDGRIDPPETCDDDSPLCQSCQSQPQQISSPNEGARKRAPSLALLPGALLASYADEAAGDVAMRALSREGRPLEAPLEGAFFLPTRSGQQAAPALCASASHARIVYEQGDDLELQTFDIDLNPQGAGASVQTGARGAAIACAEGQAFVAWRERSSGRVLGRLFDGDTAGRVQQLGGASDGARVSVARRAAGWVIAWEAGRQIRLRVTGPDGTPSGGELRLEGDAQRAYPTLAALEDGRFGLSYLEGAEGAHAVRLQRYDADGRALGSAVRVSDSTADCAAPSVTAAAVVGGGYAVAWVEADTVRARWLGGNSGFLLNPTAGVEGSFEIARGPLDTPALIATERDLFVAWHAAEAAGGVVLRTLPLPSR